MTSATASDADALTLARGLVTVRIARHPLRIDVLRGARTIVRDLELWCATGEVHDQFISFTEGVIAREELEPAERVVGGSPVETLADGAELALRCDSGRHGRLRITLPGDDLVSVELELDGAPLRLAADWDARDGERFGGLGARHHTSVDHAGREIQLGADRRYTGPDCPPDMLAAGGIPQGDYAPVPWLQSSRGYAVWVLGHGNGMRFELGARTVVSTRANAGPLRLRLDCRPSPAARLRRFLRRTGLPPVLAEWGYGFWKSRDVYGHQDEVVDDVTGCWKHDIPLDAVVLDSPWETQYNTWIPNPHQFPDFTGMLQKFRDGGVRTVAWVTPWVNLESADGQMPPDAESKALHEAPASNYQEGADRGHYVHGADGEPYVARWWMGTGSPIDFTSKEAEAWWREQAKAALRLGIEGIKADDGEGYYLPDDVHFADGTTGAQGAWAHGGRYRDSMQRALDEVHGANAGVLFGRSGWTGQAAQGILWGGDQASDFWSLKVLVASTISAAASGISNWSHDVGGYLGHRLVERCPPELLVRWAQLGCFTPLMQAHGRMEQEPWTYDQRTLDIYRGYVLLHECLVPYVRAAAATAARCGLPIVRPLSLMDPADDRGWSVADAFGYGPSLWVAPVVEEGARDREVVLPRGDWIEAWSGREVVGGGEVTAPAPLEAIPVWVRRGALIVTHPAWHVAQGLGDTQEDRRPLEATLWGEPPCGHAAARLVDGTRVSWRRGTWSVDREREVAFRVR